MKYEVDYEKLFDFGKDVIKTSYEIENTYTDVLSVIEEVNSYWQGVDNVLYSISFSNFVVDQIDNNEKLTELGEKIVAMAKKYGENDKEFLDAVKKDLEALYE